MIFLNAKKSVLFTKVLYSGYIIYSLPYLLIMCCTPTLCLAFSLVLVTQGFIRELLPMGLPTE